MATSHRLWLSSAIGIGTTLGALWVVRERRSRRAAERFGAAALESLLRAIDANDAITGAHVRRVAAVAGALADAAGLSPHARRQVERVALFHDIGKIDEALFDIVHDASGLTAAERRAIRTHPERGAAVLAPLSPFYPELAQGVLTHHERWDGSGYPKGLRGRRIPITARIVAIADTYDVVACGRPYQSAEPGHAEEIIAQGRGTQFDPELVDLFLSPPVLDAARQAVRQLQRRPRLGQHRGKRVERVAPDVRFRWRSAMPARPSRDRAPRISP